MNSYNKKLIIFAVLILVVLGFFIFAGKKPSNNTEQMANLQKKTVVTPSDESEFSGNMFDLVKSGGNVSCTFSSEDKEYTMSGTSYISGKQMRVDSTTTVKSQTPMVGHMISDGEWVYSWTSAMPQGFKMKISDAEKTTKDTPNKPNEMPALRDNTSQFNADYNFKCKKWNPDKTMFQIPSDVTFSDFSKMLPTAGNEQSGPNNACAACNYIQDASAKAQCLQSLKCN